MISALLEGSVLPGLGVPAPTSERALHPGALLLLKKLTQFTISIKLQRQSFSCDAEILAPNRVLLLLPLAPAGVHDFSPLSNTDNFTR
jgi:hypothetical protein